MKTNHKTNKYLFLIFTLTLLTSCAKSKEKIHLENIQKGEKLYNSVGCATCHSISGEKRYGPKLNDILGTETNVIRNGKEYTIIIDRNYIKKSIIDPDYEKSILFKNSRMAKPSLTDHEVDCITSYLTSIYKKPTEN